MHNSITLLGNLTRDIELRYTQGNVAVASTGIATSHKYKSGNETKEETMFIDLTFFGKSGEIANQYLRKGSKVFIVGRLKLDTWTDNQGQKRSKHTVIVETMKMLDSKPQTDSGYKQGQNEPAYQDNGQPNPNYDPNPKTTQYNNQPQVEYQNAQGKPMTQQHYEQKHTPASMPEDYIPEDQIPF